MDWKMGRLILHLVSILKVLNKVVLKIKPLKLSWYRGVSIKNTSILTHYVSHYHTWVSLEIINFKLWLGLKVFATTELIYFKRKMVSFGWVLFLRTDKLLMHSVYAHPPSILTPLIPKSSLLKKETVLWRCLVCKHRTNSIS